jgi:hypothetical protein
LPHRGDRGGGLFVSVPEQPPLPRQPTYARQEKLEQHPGLELAAARGGSHQSDEDPVGLRGAARRTYASSWPRSSTCFDIHVHIVQWEPCDTCAGKGLLAASGPRRRIVGAAGYLPRKPTLYPDCLRTRQILVVRVSGNVPELLVAALAEGAEIAEITPDVGPVFSFQAVVRVA